MHYNDACSIAMNEWDAKLLYCSYLLAESISKFSTVEQNISHVDLLVGDPLLVDNLFNIGLIKASAGWRPTTCRQSIQHRSHKGE